ALGQGAQATHNNAAALGAGAVTTRDNQVVLGGAGTSVALPGITGLGARSNQSGPTSFVTSDTNGNIATTNFGPDDLLRADRRLKDGVALALAAGGSPPLLPGRRFAVYGSFSNYDGAGAFGGGATGLLYDTKNYAVVLNAGFGVGFNTGVVGGR